MDRTRRWRKFPTIMNWCQIDTSCSSSGLVVNWFWIHWFACPSLLQIQVSWLSIVVRFKRFVCQLIWNSNDLVVNWSEIQAAGWSTDVWLKWFWLFLDRASSDLDCQATWDSLIQPFHGLCAGGFKHRRRKTRNPRTCHAKRIVSEPLQIHHACQCFCSPHELLCLPRILRRVEIPAPATRKALWTSKSGPRPWCFNDFDFRIALTRRRGANFGDFNFQKCSDTVSFSRFWLFWLWCKFWRLQLPKVPRGFHDFDFQIVLARRRGANFAASSAADPPHPPVLRSWLSQPAKPQNYGKTQHFAHFLPAKSSCLTSLLYHICAITSLDWQIFSSNFQYSLKLDS